MAVLTQVGINAGVPNSGTGTSSTLDAFFSAAAPAVLIAGTATAAAVALPVAISPNGLNANGQAAMATSAPVVLASDQTLATGAIIPVGPLRAMRGINLVTIGTTTETVIATGVAGLFYDLYGLVLANTSATASTVIIKDSTAGTSRFEFMVPGGDTRGFMLPGGSATPQAASNTGWTATLGTSIASMVVTALYVKTT